jgi:micrococcal nuclease
MKARTTAHAQGSLLLFIVLTVAAPLSAQRPPSPIADERRQLGDAPLVAEEVFTTTVADVVDGVSVVVNDSGRLRALRLDGVDAPEISQAFGREARDFLSALVKGKTVTVRLKGNTSASGEGLARIELERSDLQATLVQRGMAWYCRRFTDDRELAAAETLAKDAKLGLWAASNVLPPWKYRGVTACWQ